MVDHDPASGCFYEPVDLDDPATCSRRTACRRPRATRSSTSRWSTPWRCARSATSSGRSGGSRSGRRIATRSTGKSPRTYVPRLRIYPHALREANAYYSPTKKALLFGYFPAAGRRRDGATPRQRVHLPVPRHRRARDDARAARRHAPPLQRAEQSRRARLPRGVRRLVALFQHFSLPEVLRAPDRRDPRRPREPEPARRARAAVRPGDRQARRAAQRDRRGRRGDRRVEAARARSGRLRQRSPSRTRAARSWSPPSSTPS